MYYSQGFIPDSKLYTIASYYFIGFGLHHQNGIQNLNKSLKRHKPQHVVYIN